MPYACQGSHNTREKILNSCVGCIVVLLKVSGGVKRCNVCRCRAQQTLWLPGPKPAQACQAVLRPTQRGQGRDDGTSKVLETSEASREAHQDYTEEQQGLWLRCKQGLQLGMLWPVRIMSVAIVAIQACTYMFYVCICDAVTV